MKALVQRVTCASVTGEYISLACAVCIQLVMHVPLHVVGEREVSAIGKGMCVLLGISRHDTQREAEWM